MAIPLIIAAWKSNGLSNHIPEIKIFLTIHKVDIVLISESHATNRSVIKISKYTVYYANHPDGRAHGGSAIIIKNSLRHYELEPYITEKIQSAKVKIQTPTCSITIAAIFSLPRHMVSTLEYQHYFNTLCSRCLVAGDWNAKRTNWGSRLITLKGKNLLDAIQQDNLRYLSTGEPTYWPTDGNNIPDLLNFAITKRLSAIHCEIQSNYDLNSDHSPIITTVTTVILFKEPEPRLYTKQTN
jgi:exonuclease III